jgi:hypothetical protein
MITFRLTLTERTPLDLEADVPEVAAGTTLPPVVVVYIVVGRGAMLGMGVVAGEIPVVVPAISVIKHQRSVRESKDRSPYIVQSRGANSQSRRTAVSCCNPRQ